MSEFRESVKNLKPLGLKILTIKDVARELESIKKLEKQMEQSSSNLLPNMPSSISLKELIDKISKSEVITSYDKRNIPFILYDDKCKQTTFFKAISMLDMAKKSHIKRLLLVYLLQYDDANYKTAVLARILLGILAKKPFQTRDKLLASGMNNSKFLFSSDRLKYMATLIAKTKDIDKLLGLLSFPSMLKDCKFITASLLQYYNTNSYSLDDQYSLFTNITETDKQEGYLSVFPRIADVLIPRIENTRSAKKNEYRNGAIELFDRMLGDPRFGYKSIRWNSVSNQSRTIFLRWIAEKDLDLFFKIIEETAVDAMWRYRKEFWRKYLPYISKTWVYFGKSAMSYVQKIDNSNTGYGKLGKGALSNQSVFVFQIDKFVFAEWSHNGSLRVWLEEDSPNVFYNQEIDKSVIINAFPFPLEKWVHAGKDVYGWQRRVAAWLKEHCKLI